MVAVAHVFMPILLLSLSFLIAAEDESPKIAELYKPESVKLYKNPEE